MEPEDKTTQGEATPEQQEPEAGQETPGAGEPGPETQAEASAGTQEQAAMDGSPGGELETAKARAAENWDKYVRLQAEFENYKRRMHKEQSDSLKYAQLPVLREMVGILDNFERAVEHARANPSPELEGIVSGIDMVVQQMVSAFEKFGMTRIKALGEVFDPTLHEAMSIRETEEVPENQVVDEFQPGYVLHDRVVRPAMVVVSKKPAGAGENAEKPTEG